MIFKNFSSLCGIFFLIAFSSCIPDPVMPSEEYGSLTLSIETSSEAAINAKREVSPAVPIQNIVITIKDKEGNDTDYTRKSLETYEFQGVWITEKINLPVGDYQIIAIHLTDTASTILYAGPQKNSPVAKQVQQPLPVSFHIGNNPDNGLNIEVVSTEHYSPRDFGFDPSLVQFRETFYFFLALVKTKVDEFMEYVPATMVVSGGDYTYREILDEKIHKIVLQKGFERYTVRIDPENYSSYEKTFSYDSLLLYSSNPLIIELERNTGPECLGGSHVGDVVLLSQKDVDDFGKKCYTKIEGALTIGSSTHHPTLPIVDLNSLETLREITQDLNIINNPNLVSLMGLQYLEKVNQLHLEKNERLPSFNGLRRLKTLESFAVVECNSLTDFEGLPWEDINLESLIISYNKNLRNLQGIEKLSKVEYIHIKHNPALNTVDLPNIGEARSLSITSNSSLTSLSGFRNSISSLSSTNISNNPVLEDLKGLLANGGKITGTVMISGNAALTSLEGLRFSEHIHRLVIEDNPLLTDISALKDTRAIDIYLEIINNDQLTNLNGLENLTSVGDPWSPLANPDLSITDNKSLSDFCALTKLFQNEIPTDWRINSNAFNPTASDLLKGNCAL